MGTSYLRAEELQCVRIRTLMHHMYSIWHQAHNYSCILPAIFYATWFFLSCYMSVHFPSIFMLHFYLLHFSICFPCSFFASLMSHFFSTAKKFSMLVKMPRFKHLIFNFRILTYQRIGNYWCVCNKDIQWTKATSSSIIIMFAGEIGWSASKYTHLSG